MLSFHELRQGDCKLKAKVGYKQECIKETKEREEIEGKEGKGKKREEERKGGRGRKGDTKFPKARVVSSLMCHSCIPSFNKDVWLFVPQILLCPGNTTVKNQNTVSDLVQFMLY